MTQGNDTTTRTTHTPGPWRKGDHAFDIVAEEYTVVATVAHDRQGLNRGRELSEANARLIAAAPELLDALKAAQPVLEMLALDGAAGNSVAEQIRDDIRAAIAKAEGRTL